MHRAACRCRALRRSHNTSTSAAGRSRGSIPRRTHTQKSLPSTPGSSRKTSGRRHRHAVPTRSFSECLFLDSEESSRMVERRPPRLHGSTRRSCDTAESDATAATVLLLREPPPAGRCHHGSHPLHRDELSRTAHELATQSSANNVHSGDGVRLDEQTIAHRRLEDHRQVPIDDLDRHRRQRQRKLASQACTSLSCTLANDGRAGRHDVPRQGSVEAAHQQHAPGDVSPWQPRRWTNNSCLRLVEVEPSTGRAAELASSRSSSMVPGGFMRAAARAKWRSFARYHAEPRMRSAARRASRSAACAASACWAATSKILDLWSIKTIDRPCPIAHDLGRV